MSKWGRERDSLNNPEKERIHKLEPHSVHQHITLFERWGHVGSFANMHTSTRYLPLLLCPSAALGRLPGLYACNVYGLVYASKWGRERDSLNKRVL